MSTPFPLAFLALLALTIVVMTWYRTRVTEWLVLAPWLVYFGAAWWWR